MAIDVHSEHVLVVPTALFHRLGYFQGFQADSGRYLAELLAPEQISYRPRGLMEQDPAFKQLIPYCLFQYRDPGGAVSVFQYTRGSGQGERRLHAQRSVGVGGHISVEDAASTSPALAGDPYREGLRRELLEEVVVDAKSDERCVGLINDDETEVGRVHLGIVHLFDLERPAVRARESELLDGGFRPVTELLGELEAFETWSRICLQALYGPT